MQNLPISIHILLIQIHFFTGDKQINRILVKKNNKYGIYDGEKGKYFIEPNYDHIVYSCKKRTKQYILENLHSSL